MVKRILCIWEDSPYEQCHDPATVIFLWGCWRCDSYTEKFYCASHWGYYKSATLFDYCGKCKTASGTEYLERTI